MSRFSQAVEAEAQTPINIGVSDWRLAAVGDVTLYEQQLRQNPYGLPPDLLTALVEALKGIQESDLPGAVKWEAVVDHGKLTEELMQPEPKRHPLLLRKFWAGLSMIGDRIPAVVKLGERLKGVVPGLG